MTEPTWDIVGMGEVANRLGVQVHTVRQWRYRGLMPAPDFPLANRPLWDWPTIEAWARATGRLTG